ncbi:MAG: type II toxin-antitoxin system HigA family antitoxin [Ktedonobacterales bacterium]
MAALLDKETKAGFLALVHDFPLVSIRNDAHLAAALKEIDRLLDCPQRTTAEEEFLRALTDLVETYENAHVAIPPTPGVEALRFLMAEHGLTQADLAPLLGTPSIISEVLAGKRHLALAHITRLAERFGVPADVFIESRRA